MTLHVGIDFDNTFVTYDDLFYKYALEQKLIHKKVKRCKQNIRDCIRELPDGNARWTELQAHVYGYKMHEAQPAEGIGKFLQQCVERSVKVSVISHKTMYPALGPKINLREVARQWLLERGFLKGYGLSDDDVVFVGTLDDKIEQIFKRRCTHFVDDLAEVFQHQSFPKNVEKCLYSSGEKENVTFDARCFVSWDEISKYFFEI